MIGTTLDKYEVLQKVGEGGMATVYRGRHSTLDRDVAIKVLHPHLSSSSRNRMRFAREAKAVERLRHDNILEIFDYSGSEAEDCYIVTEFVQGETLTHLLHRTGRMPSEAVALIGIEVARALAYAHRQGILHRDLKPDNVMVRVDGAIKLMDFGIARFLDESQVTMTGALVGSPAFMSPEQAQELPLDARSDLFSLGTVLYYLVTGHLPFSGSNPSLILKNVIEGKRLHVTELAPTMSASLADVVEQLLATNPDDRFVTASDVEQSLLACLAETHVDPADASWSVRAFVDDPEAWTSRLDEHLTRVLADEGRQRLAEGDHLAALRLFNRLLSMDEENTEVLALVQNLHGAPSDGRGASLVWLPVILIALILAVGVWRWTVGSRTAAEPEGPVAVAATAATDAASDRAARVEDPEGEAPTAVPVEAAEVPPEPETRPVADPPVDPAPSRVVATPRVKVRRPVAPVEPAPAEPEVAPVQHGTLLVNAHGYTGQVYVGGRPVGQTYTEIPMMAGVYDVTVKAEFAHDRVVRDVRIEPDRRNVLEVQLELKPRRVEFRGWPDACRLKANGQDANTLGSLERYWLVEQPDRRLTIEVTCPDGRRVVRHWDYLPYDQPDPVVEAPPLDEGSRGGD